MSTGNKRKTAVCDNVTDVTGPVKGQAIGHKGDVAPSQAAVIQAAAEWLAAQPSPPHPVVPLLKERFHLSGLEACRAIAQAQQIRSERNGVGAA